MNDSSEYMVGGIIILIVFILGGLFGALFKEGISDYGGLKETCFTNKTCIGKLTCVSNICVDLNEEKRKDLEQSECKPAEEE